MVVSSEDLTHTDDVVVAVDVMVAGVVTNLAVLSPDLIHGGL